MTAELHRLVSVPTDPPVDAPGRSVTVLAPLLSPDESSDLERPEAATIEVFDAVNRVSGPPPHQLVPVRRLAQPGPYVSSSRRSVEMLDATTLEDVASALAQNVSRLVHAVGWEAGVVAAALRSSHGEGTQVLLEPLGPPGSPVWTLSDHAALMIIASDLHYRDALRHGVPRSLLRVVPAATPHCPDPVEWSDDGSGKRLLGVVGDGIDAVLLESIEVLLRADESLHVVFAGEAARLVRERRLAVTIRGWAESVSSRVHGTSRVTWPLLARVDLVLDVGGAASTPLAAMAAGASRRAVVAIAQRPAAEVVEHGTTGVVLPGTDPRRLPAALCELLGSASCLGTLGAGGRLRWEREHSPEARAQRLAALYDGLAPG